MNIAALRTRITFQKNTLEVDEYRNHGNTWEPWFSCYATVSKTGGQEQSDASTSVLETIDFTVRACSELSGVEPDKFRIVCKGKIYNIIYIDPMAFKGSSLKFRCETERRNE